MDKYSLYENFTSCFPVIPSQQVFHVPSLPWSCSRRFRQDARLFKGVEKWLLFYSEYID
jgi:hypothetical protein